MTDNTKHFNIQDKGQMNMHEQWQVIYWTKKWEITDDQLRKAWKHAQSSSVQKIYDAAVFLKFIDKEL